MKKYVVIGAGPAGAAGVETLRKLNKESEITVVTDEGYPFYRREHIAGLLSDDETEETLFEKGRDFYDKLGTKLVKARVIRIASDKNDLVLDNGSTIHYDALLIASGGKPIVPPWPGIQLKGVSSFYTLDDAKRVAESLEEAKNVAVIGAGTIAMKAVPILSRMGLRVTLIEKMNRLWPTMFDKQGSEVVEHRFRENEVEVLLNEEVNEFKGENGKVQAVSLKSQHQIPCDLALIAIGIRPNIDFLNQSGIKFDRGVLVNNHLQTNVPNVYAAGDVAQVPDPLFQTPMLHPNWSYAEEQGAIAASNMTGIERSYEGAVPLTTFDVYDLSVVAAGITQPDETFEEVSRRALHEGTYRKIVVKDGRLMGALIIGKGINRKTLKPLILKAVLTMVNVENVKTELLNEDSISNVF